jgi:nicotinamidase-related amidase
MPQPAIDPQRTALLLFDMVNGFVHSSNPERARHVKESHLVERCVQITDAARAAGVRVFYASSEHRRDGTDYAPTLVDANHELVPYPDGPQLMDNPPPFEGTPEAEIIDELAPRPEDYVLTKRRWSAFAGTPLDILLRGLGIDTILLAGGSTDIGIIATAYAARDLGYHLVILRDACGTHRPGAQDFSMDRLFPRLARVMTVEQAAGLIDR